MKNYLTRIDGVPDAATVHPGMAYFAGTGPAKKTCGDCQHRGYWVIGRKTKRGGCRKFLQFAMRHGPDVEVGWSACKYFEGAT